MTTSIRRRPVLRWVLYSGLVALVGGLVVSWYVGGGLIAPAPRTIGDPPPDLVADIFTLPSESGSKLAGWHVRSGGEGGVVVLLHGIRSSRLGMLDRARLLDRLGYSTVLIDLQAHGASPGKRITVGQLEKYDVRAAVDYARSQHPVEPIGVIGVSLGGAAALLASPLEIDALVLESVFPTIYEAVHNRVAAQLGPLSAIPTALLMMQLQPRLGATPSQLRPIDHLPDVESPVFVISGAADRLTTVAETRAMFAAASEPKDLWLVTGAVHEDMYAADPEQYEQRIAAFFERHLSIARR